MRTVCREGQASGASTARQAITGARSETAAVKCHAQHRDLVISLPPELTVNNNAQHLRPLLHHGQSGSGCLSGSGLCRQCATRVVATFADYSKLQVAMRSGSNTSGRHSLNPSEYSKVRQSIFNQPQLTTFAEYQKQSMIQAERRSRANPQNDLRSDNDQSSPFTLDDSLDRDDEAAAVASEATVIADQEGEEDAESVGTQKKAGRCACCSRGRKAPDTSGRRKLRLVGKDGAEAGVPNRVVSISLEDDAELADVNELDPTITLMPYVLFESERAKVLYQAVGIGEAELLKRAINLYANDMYKKVLMRLYMHRYIRLFKEAVVRAVLSKQVALGPESSALAATVLGIEIAYDSQSSQSTSSSTAAALSVGLGFGSPVIRKQRAMDQPVSNTLDYSRQLFQPAPKFTDGQILELLNSGKVIDVTGRASLESLVSLPTTKVGQRRNHAGL